jgi:large subunit ribosomal protein L30
MNAKKKATQADVKRLKITLKRSLLGWPGVQKRTALALGLRKMHASVEHMASPTILGMVNAITHLVTVEELN